MRTPQKPILTNRISFVGCDLTNISLMSTSELQYLSHSFLILFLAITENFPKNLCDPAESFGTSFSLSTIVVKNNETNDKFYRKVAFPRYTESVKFMSQS